MQLIVLAWQEEKAVKQKNQAHALDLKVIRLPELLPPRVDVIIDGGLRAKGTLSIAFVDMK